MRKISKLFLVGTFVAGCFLCTQVNAQTETPTAKSEGRTVATASDQENSTQATKPSKGLGMKGLGAQRGKSGPVNVDAEIDPARRESVMKFVEENQPQLKRLLGALEKNRPQQFRRAFGLLTREVERLQDLKDRDSERFDHALNAWKNQKEIELVSAHIALRGENEESRKKLRELIVERRKLALEGIDAEKKSLERRLGNLTRQQADLQNESDIDARVDQAIARAKKIKSDRDNQKSDAKSKSDPAK